MTNEKTTRGKFLRLLGKVGILSFLTSIPAFGAERGKFELKESDDRGITDIRGSQTLKLRRTRSPKIRGKVLSETALTARLATDNLENLRDLVTGRFFGNAAREIYKDGYIPLIKWNLGADGGDSGCFFYADTADPNRFGEIPVENCGLYVTGYEDNGKLTIGAFSSPWGGKIDDLLGGSACGAKVDPTPPPCPGKCNDYCPSHCGVVCSGEYCGGHCSPKVQVDLHEIVSYPADKFVSEITEILETTDLGTIERELKAVIFSDEVLNLGLEQFVLNANDMLGFESTAMGG